MDVLSLQSALWNINVLNITFPEAQFNNASSSGNTDSSSATVTTHRPATASIFSCHAAVPGDSVAGESPSEGVGEYYDIPFPSCYTWPQIILFAAFMAVVMFVIVFGNLLVIISIMTNASLKTVQNYLLVSLAMADCCVGALIMPLSLANEVMGYWAFGDFLCDSWLALDVLLCTASIFSLCAISLDRYWSVTQAVTYLQKRTPRRAGLMIAAVWASSLAISVPPLLGWRVPPNATEIVSFDNGTVHESTFVKTCSVGEDTSEYVIFSSLGSFWIPVAVMTFVYVKIYLVARSRASGTGGHSAKHNTTAHKSPPLPAARSSNNNINSAPVPNNSSSHLSRNLHVAVDTHRGSSVSSSTTNVKNHEKKPLLVRQSLQPGSPLLKNSDQNNRPLDGEDSESYPDSKTPTSEDGSPSSSSDKKSKGVRKKDCSTQTDVVIVDEERPLYIDDDEFADSSSIMLLSEYDFDERWREFFDKHFPKEDLLIPIAKHLPNGTPKVASVAVISTTSLPFYRRALRFLVGMFRGTDASSTRGYRLQVNKDPCRVDSHTKKKSRRTLKKSFKKLHHTHTDAQNEAERRRKKMQKLKERRATLVVTLVIATFVLCWAPFFIILPLQAICGAVVCYVHPKIFSTVFWLGYFNSALNPVIYTIFNRDMRRAFKRILLGNDYTRKKETRRQRIGI
ncbi:putative Alpha-2C adrenergic receptor [Hypsibius exemplaris]|uniref:Alpha-2C adrenergic receptor n=1 Tax=Hypsibius exemplaris TaxID=2072580 RepID=A0A1W0WKL8_HYPEX|nr:putative Alpha-2C adrenergic receptor [Hypsibius exemplaris]